MAIPPRSTATWPGPAATMPSPLSRSMRTTDSICTITAVGAIGSAQITATADADLGDRRARAGHVARCHRRGWRGGRGCHQRGPAAAASRTASRAAVMTDPMLQFFAFEHLRDDLKPVSAKFAEIAQFVCDQLPRNPERTVALRKLLEAKECAVRARLFKESRHDARPNLLDYHPDLGSSLVRACVRVHRTVCGTGQQRRVADPVRSARLERLWSAGPQLKPWTSMSAARAPSAGVCWA